MSIGQTSSGGQECLVQAYESQVLDPEILNSGA